MAREPLEAALATSWTRGNLAVYGDYLQSIHDPRGELIAIDLHLLRNGSSQDLQARRAVLLEQCGMARFGNSAVTYGFVELWLSSSGTPGLELFRTSPFAPYLRSLAIRASLERIRHELRELARLGNPWLRKITLAPEGGAAAARPLIGKRLGVELIAATPRLEVLELLHFKASSFAATFAHPTARIVHTVEPRTKLHIEVGGAPHLIELGRFTRLHTSIADELPDAARDAWAELRFAVDQLPLGEEREFPSDLLARAIDALDLGSYYGRDWQSVRAKLTADPVRLRCV